MDYSESSERMSIIYFSTFYLKLPITVDILSFVTAADIGWGDLF